MWNISKYRISVNWKVICFGTSRKKNVGIMYKVAYDASIPPSLCHFANEGIKWFILTPPKNMEKITIVWKSVNISDRQLRPLGIDPLHFSAFYLWVFTSICIVSLASKRISSTHFWCLSKEIYMERKKSVETKWTKQHVSIFLTCYFRWMGMVAKTRTVWPLM